MMFSMLRVFTGLIQRRVLTIFLWDLSHLLILNISIKIVLAHVFSFPTNLVSNLGEKDLGTPCALAIVFGAWV